MQKAKLHHLYYRSYRQWKALLCFALLFFVVVSCGKDSDPQAPIPPEINSMEILQNDMLLPHEAQLNGLPESFDWSQGPRVGWGNQPPLEWKAMIPWGQVYRDPNLVELTNTRIHIRKMQAWYLNPEMEWVKWITTSDLYGRHYFEDYRGDINIEADIRQEASGGISVVFKEGYNFHFWPRFGRVNIQPEEIRGVWISVEARVIMDRANGVDNRALSNYLMGSGGDYWKSLTAPWDNFNSSGDIGIGRMKYLSTDWKAFNMHTLDDERLDNYPPPFDQP